MIEYFTEARKKHHRHLELRLRADYTDGTVLGNSETVRQGINKIIGYAGSRAGLPFPSCCSVKVAADGPAFSLNLEGDPGPFLEVSPAEDGSIAMYRLVLALKLLPTKFFGTEQALRWMELAKFPPFGGLLDQALAALEDPTGYESMSKILIRLVEERIPLSDTATILKTVVSAGPVAPGDDALWSIVEDVRVALKDASARYYVDYYVCRDAYAAGSDLLAALETPGGLEQAGDAICRVAAALDSTFILVVNRPERRRHLWEVTESLFTGSRLNRPAVVLKSSEISSKVSLPDRRREIRLVPASGV